MIGWLVRKAQRAAVWAYFRRIDAEGLEHVPATGGILVAANHVNSLVDPIVLEFHLRRGLVGTAKASLARNPYLGFLMRALGMIRFHRPGEGDPRATVVANRAAIRQCRDVLEGGGGLLIFPEGKSHSRPAMLPFKAGLSRIALGVHGPLQIVPVGLYYERKERFRSAASVRFGPPLDVATWTGSGTELTEEVRQRIAALCVQHDSRREAPLTEFVGRLLETEGTAPPELRDEPPLTQHVERLQHVVAGYRKLRSARPDAVVDLEERVRAYRHGLFERGLGPDDVFLRVGWGRALHFALGLLELVLVGGPLAAWGWLVNLPPFLAVRGATRALSKERDQWASNAVYSAIVVYPVMHVLQLALAWVLLPTLWAVVYTLATPFCSAYYLPWRDRIGAAVRRVRTFFRWKRDPGMQARLADEGREIIRAVYALAADAGVAGDAPGGAS